MPKSQRLTPRVLIAGLALLAVAVVTGCGSTVQLGANATGSLASGTVDGLSATTTDAPSGSPTQLSDTGPGSSNGAGGASDAPTAIATTAVDTSPDASSVTGPAANTKPIALGFTTTATSNAAGAGYSSGSTMGDDQIIKAVAAYYNAHGGLQGRKINPILAYTDTGGSDWASEFQAACATFTQDNHVSAVLGYQFVHLDSYEQCLTKAGVPHANGGFQPGDAAAQAQFPNLVSIAHPSVDVADIAVIDGALRSGVITTKTKIGLIIDDCSHGYRAFDRSMKPWLDARKLNYDVVKGPCGSGAGDLGSAASALASAELKFSSDGVKAVYGSAVVVLLFSAAASSQNYHPLYLTGIGGAALEPNMPKGQVENVHGFGWMPAEDVAPNHQPYGRTAAQTACLKMLNAAGLKPQKFNDFMIAYTTCDAVSMYARALDIAKGDIRQTAILPALTEAMVGFKGAVTYGGGLINVPKQRGGAALYRHYRYTSGCSCYTYTGPTYAMPRI